MEGENKETKLARSSVDLRQLECWKVAKLSRRSSGRSRGSGSVKVEVIGAGEAEPYNTVRTIALILCQGFLQIILKLRSYSVYIYLNRSNLKSDDRT